MEEIRYDSKEEFLKDALKASSGKSLEDKTISIVSASGEDIQRLSSHQKNAIYAKAKLMKEQIRSALLSHEELWDPSEQNINKFQKTEGNPEYTQMVQAWRNFMISIGADPKDYSVEHMRKGKQHG